MKPLYLPQPVRYDHASPRKGKGRFAIKGHGSLAFGVTTDSGGDLYQPASWLLIVIVKL
jgi:hypothetical protein